MVRKHMSNKDLLNDPKEEASNSKISKKSKIRYLMMRSENYEKQVAELLQSLSSYARRMAKLRDAGDNVAETLNSISDAEVLNPSSKKAIAEVSKTFRIIQDHRDSEILYLEDKLLPFISDYGEQLQKQREELRSSVGKLFENNQRGGFGWIRSTSSGSGSVSNQSLRRRSQSMERLDRFTSKEEKSLQQLIQRYELKKNLLFKRLLLKLMLTELRFTIRSFNSLTFIYKHVLDQMNPTKDLKFFNEFFKFSPIKKSNLSEMDLDMNGLVSDDNENDDDDDEEESEGEDDEDSGNEEADERNDPDEDQEDSISIKSEKSTNSNNNRPSEDEDDQKPRIKYAASTLKRFNSTPEISSSKNVSDLVETIKKRTGKNSSKSEKKAEIQSSGKSKMITNKMAVQNRKSSKAEAIKKGSKLSSDDEDSDDSSDDSDTENDIDEQLDSSISGKKQQQNSRPSSLIVSKFKNRK